MQNIVEVIDSQKLTIVLVKKITKRIQISLILLSNLNLLKILKKVEK